MKKRKLGTTDLYVTPVAFGVLTMGGSQMDLPLQEGAELDLVTIDLQAAYMALKEIVGEASREDLLDALFSKFCLGK